MEGVTEEDSWLTQNCETIFTIVTVTKVISDLRGVFSFAIDVSAKTALVLGTIHHASLNFSASRVLALEILESTVPGAQPRISAISR